MTFASFVKNGFSLALEGHDGNGLQMSGRRFRVLLCVCYFGSFFLLKFFFLIYLPANVNYRIVEKELHEGKWRGRSNETIKPIQLALPK